MLFSEFSEKEVISVKTCKRLGQVYDLEFDKCTGQICKIIVREKNWFFNMNDELQNYKQKEGND